MKNEQSDNIYEQTKSLRKRGRKVGRVHTEVLNLLDNDRIEPGSTFQMALRMTNPNEDVSFKEIQISVREVQTWASLIKPKRGNSSTMTEVTKLVDRSCTPLQEETVVHMGRKVLLLKNINITIPESATCDRKVGLVYVNHYLHIKAISEEIRVKALHFRFPFVIGGPQIENVIPSDHPVLTIAKRTSPSKALAYSYARSIIGLFNASSSIKASVTSKLSRDSDRSDSDSAPSTDDGTTPPIRAHAPSTKAEEVSFSSL